MHSRLKIHNLYMIVTRALLTCVCLISNPVLAKFSLYYAFCLIPVGNLKRLSGKTIEETEQ